MSGTLTHLRIVGANGDPVANGLLSVVRSSVPFPEIALLSDERGLVEVRLPVGRFTLRAHGQDGGIGEITIGVPTTSDQVIEIRLA